VMSSPAVVLSAASSGVAQNSPTMTMKRARTVPPWSGGVLGLSEAEGGRRGQ
jgi:hypothetical protein